MLRTLAHAAAASPVPSLPARCGPAGVCASNHVLIVFVPLAEQSRECVEKINGLNGLNPFCLKAHWLLMDNSCKAGGRLFDIPVFEKPPALKPIMNLVDQRQAIKLPVFPIKCADTSLMLPRFHGAKSP